MLFLPWWCQWVLGGSENSPQQSYLFYANRTRCYVITHRAISRPQLALKPYQQRVQTMNKLMEWFQRQAGLAREEVVAKQLLMVNPS